MYLSRKLVEECMKSSSDVHIVCIADLVSGVPDCAFSAVVGGRGAYKGTISFDIKWDRPLRAFIDDEGLSVDLCFGSSVTHRVFIPWDSIVHVESSGINESTVFSIGVVIPKANGERSDDQKILMAESLKKMRIDILESLDLPSEDGNCSEDCGNCDCSDDAGLRNGLRLINGGKG